MKDIGTLYKELKEERKRHLAEGTRCQNTLHQSISLLEKSKRAYDRAFRDSERSLENYRKAEHNWNLTRAEVEKLKQISYSKIRLCDEAKAEYASQLQQTNDLQRRHYNSVLPAVFRKLQDMEERRAKCIQMYVQKSAKIRRDVIPIVDKCIQGMISAADLIDPVEDSRLVIDKYKTGVEPPTDFPFEEKVRPLDELLNGDDTVSVDGKPEGKGSTTLQYSKSVCTDTFRNTLGAGKFKKRANLFSHFFTTQKVSNWWLLLSVFPLFQTISSKPYTIREASPKR